MRRLLNTLYVSTEGAYIRKNGENAVVEIDGQEKLRAPLHLLGGVICFGRANMSPALMGACAERGVTAAFFTENGKFLARVEGPVSGNVLLRREQYRRGDAPLECGAIVSAIVAGKAQNQRTVLKRAMRDHGERLDADELARLDAAQTRLRDIARKAVHLSDTEGHALSLSRVGRPLAGAWIETDQSRDDDGNRLGRPLAGAWIETSLFASVPGPSSASPSRGGVDRNHPEE